MLKRLSFAAILLMGSFAFSSAGHATTVATISGCYDCVVFDTPTLVINNTTGGTMSNAQMVLHGYQGANNGLTATVLLGDLGITTTLNWGSLPGVPGGTTPGNLTAYDYDDEYIGTPQVINDPTCGGSGCVAGGGSQWYAQVGNFSVTFTAQISGGLFDGQLVHSVFSPTTNATGSFVGWEGLDPSGFSESSYDIHSGVITGDLANIDLGAVPNGVPEPSTWAMMVLGFVGLGFAGYRSSRKRGAVEA